ncbi:MAG TPA: hypothetical protein VEY92_13135 [Pseudoxanthomonas sp.]|nr:hypothetical protein [Pseudoxanthomonas sp.]
MRATCPDCGAQAHLSAFFVEDDGKRLAALLADMQPELGRAVIAYLGLFKPGKNALRLPRAVKLVQELASLINAGSVCRDERNGVRRPASPAMWANGIEQMLAQRASLTLPLENHNYLRAVVFGLADKADAASERQREESARAGRHLGSAPPAQPKETPLERQLAWIRQQEGYGAFTPEQAEEERAKACTKYGASK